MTEKEIEKPNLEPRSVVFKTVIGVLIGATIGAALRYVGLDTVDKMYGVPKSEVINEAITLALTGGFIGFAYGTTANKERKQAKNYIEMLENQKTAAVNALKLTAK